MDTRARTVKEIGDRLFSKRFSLMSLWQTTAEQFYPERADFTTTFTLGDEFAAHLMTGVPVLARRDLANNFAAMLRPRGAPWFHARTMNDKINEDSTALKWLDWATERMRIIMYDQKAQFVRATKQGDNDFAAFGQTVIQVTPNEYQDGLLYRNWHIRDVAWCEDASLALDTVHRNWSLDARSLVKLFPKTAHKNIRDCLEKEPYREFKCRHIVMPAKDYEMKEKGRKQLPYVSIYIDCENEEILEERPAPTLGYVIPRWQTVSGSQYAYSPATVVALPDARLLQQITLTLLESGQKAVDPPMVAVGDAIQGSMNVYAGGTTFVDAEYDERNGAALRLLQPDAKALNWGVDREERIEKQIHEAFYLNQLNLPEMGKDMTAYETQKRVEEYVRRALPLFEPLEVEYNGALCEETFGLVMRMGGFGPASDIPELLRGQDLRFTFESPLQSATDRSKSQAFMESANLLKVAIEFDPSAPRNLKFNTAFRDALRGVGAPSDWMEDERAVEEGREQDAKMAQVQAAAQAIGGGAQVAGQVGEAAQQLQMAGMA